MFTGCIRPVSYGTMYTMYSDALVLYDELIPVHFRNNYLIYRVGDICTIVHVL